MPRLALFGLCLWAATTACSKVPLTNVDAGFELADAVWFEDEHTLFVFYKLQAAQGLGAESQVELGFRTDELTQAFASVSSFPTVHQHVAVDCGQNARCGSTSLRLAERPRQVTLRLRYHREGNVFLATDTLLTIVGAGQRYNHRSLIVYGVFDETNTRVFWRARHQFPNLRNQEVEALGLRRRVSITGRRFGDPGDLLGDNPYGYGAFDTCPPSLQALDANELETRARSALDREPLPAEAAAAPLVCATATVDDAKGRFAATALARKNPQTRPAFPALRSPIRPNRALGYVLRPCTRVISDVHAAMQSQRLLFVDAPEVCIDDWMMPGFAEQLAARIRTRIDEERTRGEDMVLTLALHHDDPTGALADRVEDALSIALAPEREKTTPRLTGAFVFDSFGHGITREPVRQMVLWCPARAGGVLDELPEGAPRACPLLPDVPQLTFGALRASVLPILPTRAQYLRFLETYGEAQAGRMRALTFLAPERTPLSRNVQVGDFGVATFFNDEAISALPGDVFSHCPTEDPRTAAVVFFDEAEATTRLLADLPLVHETAPQPSYALGIAWDFPYLTRLDYQVTVAGAVSAFSLSVPFGISGTNTSYFGTELWRTGEFPLREALLQCERFCDHPTFDSAGVYNVLATFASTYKQECYRPRYPSVLPEEAFPLDP